MKTAGQLVSEFVVLEKAYKEALRRRPEGGNALTERNSALVLAEDRMKEFLWENREQIMYDLNRMYYRDPRPSITRI